MQADLFSPPPDGSYSHAQARAARILRDRHATLVDALDRADQSGAPYGTARMAVQIYNGGSMPASAGHFFVGNPVVFTGTEHEGGASGATVDTSTLVCVLVLGTTAPSVGDILTAYAVGGRWVAERGTGSSAGGSVSCSPCSIPASNLTLSWVNPTLGNGSTTLVYSSSGPSWISGCSNGLIYELFCTGGQIELRVVYFTSGTCPTGSSAYCSNLQNSPNGLTLQSSSCTPINIIVNVTPTNCPVIATSSYTRFAITL